MFPAKFDVTYVATLFYWSVFMPMDPQSNEYQEILEKTQEAYRRYLVVKGMMTDQNGSFINRVRDRTVEAMVEEAKARGEDSWAETFAYIERDRDPKFYEQYKQRCREVLTAEECAALEAKTQGAEAIRREQEAKFISFNPSQNEQSSAPKTALDSSTVSHKGGLPGEERPGTQHAV
jgi:hypothetical protein